MCMSELYTDYTIFQRAMQSVALTIEFIPVTQAVAERAAAIAADYCVRGCDAVYIAVAEQLGDDLITLDRQQLERGAAVVTTSRPLEAE